MFGLVLPDSDGMALLGLIQEIEHNKVSTLPLSHTHRYTSFKNTIIIIIIIITITKGCIRSFSFLQFYAQVISVRTQSPERGDSHSVGLLS